MKVYINACKNCVYFQKKGKNKKKQCIWRVTEPLACYDKVCTMFKRKKGGIK